MNIKTYNLPSGQTAVFEYDDNGIGKIALECLDSLIEMIRPQWTPCSEKLPDTDKIVLICDRHGDIRFDLIMDGHWVLRQPVAWMPLPLPYREKQP